MAVVGKHQKPQGYDSPCFGCPLERMGLGFVPGEGPRGSIAILSEQPGYDEVAFGRPMVGAAGGMLARILRRTFRTREQFYIDNVLKCVPPGGEVSKSWLQDAASHCSGHSRAALEQSPVILAMGGTAIRHALGLWDWDVKKLVENFHGTVTLLPSGQYVVGTYHPSHLQRGAANLMGVVAYDLSIAEDVATGRWQPEPIQCIVDPHPEWFRLYIDTFKAAIRNDPFIALDTDIETPDKAKGKAEDELDENDASFQIDRINFSYNDDEGITVPWTGPYIPMALELIAAAQLHYMHNGDYDTRRLLRVGAKFQGEIWDGMWLWHHYMSDVPKGLGFAAPFCSQGGAWATHRTTAWKHLFTGNPGEYAGYDPAQGRRVVNRTVEALQLRGQWEIAHRHTVRLMQEVLKPAQVIGIQVDRPALDAFEADLAAKTKVLLAKLQDCVPEADRPLTGGTNNEGMKKAPEGPHPSATMLKKDGTQKKSAEDWDPLKVELYATHAHVVQMRVMRQIQVCESCGQEEVVAKHRCKDKKLTPKVVRVQRLVERFFWQEPFNPDSPQQVLGYIKARKHKPGRNKKTKSDSADRETLTRLRATTKDPFYETLLDYRGVAKVRGTYAIGVRKRLDSNNRFHPVPTLKPSTLRTSYVSPNIQNVVADKDSTKTLAAGFRRCIVASPGCKLIELDFSGIEAVQLAWYARDPLLHRLAGLGLHAYLASHLLGRPADLAWSDADLLAYFKEIKTHEAYTYDQAKRNVHGNGYGMTPHGMWMMFPHLYPTLKSAERVQDIYFECAPAVPKLQNDIRMRAYEQGYIGGAMDRKYNTILDDHNAHPYAYRHDFFDVVTLKPVGPEAVKRLERERIPIVYLNDRPYAATWGPDSKRCLAFYPQSTAAGNLKEAAIYLFAEPDLPTYIGDAYYGQTPLRAPIHDSLLLEVPDSWVDFVLECAFTEMLRPIEEQPLPTGWNRGTYLTIGVEAKIGTDWEHMEKIKTPKPMDLGLDVMNYVPDDSLAFDRTYFPAEEAEEEDVSDLGIVVQ